MCLFLFRKKAVIFSTKKSNEKKKTKVVCDWLREKKCVSFFIAHLLQNRIVFVYFKYNFTVFTLNSKNCYKLFDKNEYNWIPLRVNILQSTEFDANDSS